MTRVAWDNVGERVFQSGIDRGVLYMPDGSAVAWNGLTSVSEKTDKAVSSVYFDGRKINDLVELGDWSGSLKAITYPDELSYLEGMYSVRRGALVTEQNPLPFGLCYRTKMGSDLNPDAGHKLHILWGVTAIPSDRESTSISDSPDASEFEWDIYAVPQAAPGLRPTAHFILNSLDLDDALFRDIEDKLYGTATTAPVLLSLTDLIAFIQAWVRLIITDNGDGTWTATYPRDDMVTWLDGPHTEFEIDGVHVTYSDSNTYTVQTTNDLSDAT